MVMGVVAVGVGGEETEQGGRMAFMPDATCSAYLARVFMAPRLIVLFQHLIPRLKYLILKHSRHAKEE